IRTVPGFLPVICRPRAVMASTCSVFASNAVTRATDDNAAANKPPIAPQPTTRICMLMPRLCAGEPPRRSPPTHISERKAGDAFVVFRQRAQFVLGDIFVEIIDRTVADEFLDLDVDEIGWVLAVGTHHAGSGPGQSGFIGLDGVTRVFAAVQENGESARVDCRLRRTIGTTRVHRVRRVPGEGDP